MGFIKSKDEKIYIKIKKKKEKHDKLKQKLETADVFTKDKLEKQVNELKEEIKKMTMQIKDGKLVPSDKVEEKKGLKIEPTEDAQEEEIQGMQKIVEQVKQARPQMPQQPVQQPRPQQYNPYEEPVTNEQYVRQIEAQRMADEEAYRQQMIAQQQQAMAQQHAFEQQQFITQQQSMAQQQRQHAVPPAPIHVRIEMTTDKVYEANIEVVAIESFIKDIDESIEDQSPMKLGDITINGRYIISYTLE